MKQNNKSYIIHKDRHSRFVIRMIYVDYKHMSILHTKPNMYPKINNFVTYIVTTGIFDKKYYMIFPYN